MLRLRLSITIELILLLLTLTSGNKCHIPIRKQCWFIAAIVAKSLTELVCQINPRHCRPQKTQHDKESVGFSKFLPSAPHLASPSAAEFARWQNYEKGEAGTGITPDSGPGFGPGLGNVNIATGVGVQTPVGGLGIRRDFDLAFGGSGRSGGRSFGFGNGHQRDIGSAPWAWP
ncbi:unnamed protein product [Cylicostephanus goldi]|uniref:Uncharacterized protein n=1 Tax=Cylicostephanus goldi TaxID=71465 RepID=A0A3P6RMY8_CYLGO|nr:unnamed protein product [Cylicostephanus goldi]